LRLIAFEIFLRQFEEFLTVVFQCLARQGTEGIGQLSPGLFQRLEFFNMVTPFQFQRGCQLGFLIV